ncbi:transposase, partial [Rhodopseudomonas sp. BR0M22]|nr:transposase [Rhodopseudomonas sp. BR0M22]
MHNGFVESFNGRTRDALLNKRLFFELHDARTKIAARITNHNAERPHSALGYLLGSRCKCNTCYSGVAMGQCYGQLSLEERVEIYRLHAGGISQN